MEKELMSTPLLESNVFWYILMVQEAVMLT
jgi:hypothetical protein